MRFVKKACVQAVSLVAMPGMLFSSVIVEGVDLDFDKEVKEQKKQLFIFNVITAVGTFLVLMLNDAMRERKEDKGRKEAFSRNIEYISKRHEERRREEVLGELFSTEAQRKCGERDRFYKESLNNLRLMRGVLRAAKEKLRRLEDAYDGILAIEGNRKIFEVAEEEERGDGKVSDHITFRGVLKLKEDCDFWLKKGELRKRMELLEQRLDDVSWFDSKKLLGGLGDELKKDILGPLRRLEILMWGGKCKPTSIGGRKCEFHDCDLETCEDEGALNAKEKLCLAECEIDRLHRGGLSSRTCTNECRKMNNKR